MRFPGGRWIAAVLLTSAVAVSAGAQSRYTFVTRGESLGLALEKLAALTGIDLIYTTEHVAGRRSYCRARDQEAEALLRCVLDGSGLEYVRSVSGAYVLIEALARRPAVGDLAGRIVDADSGEPLAYANVLLAEAASGTTTDETGLFSFASVVSGPYRVVVTYVGYETGLDSVWIDPNARRRVRIALHPKETALEPIVVDGLAQRLPSAGLGEAGLPGDAVLTASDMSGGMASLSGVAVHQPLADVLIQGSPTGEHVTLLDGVPVRDPVSLGRYLSAFSPLALGRVTVHKAGFGVEHGSLLSGLVEVTHDVPAGAGLSLSADPLSVNAKATAPVRLNGEVRGAVMAAFRSSLWDAYRDPAVESLLGSFGALDPLMVSSWTGAADWRSAFTREKADVRFSDLHAAARLQLGPFRFLDASVYRARNRLGSNSAAADTANGNVVQTEDRYDWTNWVGQMRHHWLIGARSTLSIQMQGSWNYAGYTYAGSTYAGLTSRGDGIASAADLAALADARQSTLGYYLASEDVNRIRELALKSTWSYAVSPRHHVDAGVSVSNVASSLDLFNPFILPISYDESTWLGAAYAGARLTSGLRLVLEPGVRLTYVPVRKSVYAEPRLAARYDAPGGRIAARVAAGVYRQFIHQVELTSAGASALVPFTLFWLPVDASLAPQRAYHAAAEVLWMPAASWNLSAEVYHKWQPRLVVFDYAALGPAGRKYDVQADFLTAARGRAYGGSVSARRSAGRLRPALTYTFSHAERRYPGRFGGEPQPVPSNYPHRLRVDVTGAITSHLDLTANWRGAWGRAWAYRHAYYDYAVALPGGFGPPSGDRLPPFYELDLGLTYSMGIGPARAELRSFVTNVLNRRNEWEWTLEPDGTAPLAKTLPGRHLFVAVALRY